MIWQIECQDLVDIDIYLEAKKVIDALQNMEIAPALAWCAENKSRLKKLKVISHHFSMLTLGYILQRFAIVIISNAGSSFSCVYSA